MKAWGMKTVSTLLILGVTACSGSEQTLDKRQAKLAELDTIGGRPNAGSGNITVKSPAPAPVLAEPTPIPNVTFVPPTLVATKLLDSIAKDSVVLVSKVNATETVIFLKDGKAFSYKPESTVVTDLLKPIEAAVVAPLGTTLYSLSSGQFWFVSGEKIGRNQVAADGSAATDSKTVPSQNFSVASLKGERTDATNKGKLTNLKVLFVSPNVLIMHTGSYIEILDTKNTTPQVKHLEIGKERVDLSGTVQAGQTPTGYWFRANGKIIFLADALATDGTYNWSQGPLTVAPADLTWLAMWGDAVALKAVGKSVAFSTAGWFSDVPAPASATP
ncbi:MAG: hypothetical protein H7249_15250 [Chitinophagaceae bacterium]|nr:hypothetical protein [Oligoflexus sp.]